jgi:hypothetical protein
MKMSNRKGQVEYAKEGWSRRSTKFWAWSGGRGGAGRSVGASPHDPARW